MDKTYIDFETNNHSLGLLLLTLEQNGIKSFAVVREDNDLHIRIEVDYLKKVVYESMGVKIYDDRVGDSSE